MKYICLGYIEPGKIRRYDRGRATICANGRIVDEMTLQILETAVTVYWKNGRVATTDGPSAETKE